MNIKKILAPLVTAVLGGLGAAIRKYELDVAYDDFTGLHTLWDSASVALYILIALALLWMVLVAFKSGTSLGNKAWDTAIVWEMPHAAAGIIAALLLAGSACYCYTNLWYSSFDVPWLEKLSAHMLVVSAACVLLISLLTVRGRLNGISKLCACLLPVVLCVWLLYFYRCNAVNPVLSSFVWQGIGVGAAIMGTYGYAGYMYDHRKPKLTIFCLLAAEFFCIMSVPDRLSYDNGTMFCGLALWTLTLTLSFRVDSAAKGGKRQRKE